MQRNGSFPIEKLCTFFPYTDMDKAVAAMHDGSVCVRIHYTKLLSNNR